MTEQNDEAATPTIRQRLVSFYWQNEFLVLILCCISLARAYPQLGAVYLEPEITAKWIAVCFIFFLAGVGLKTEDFSKAIGRARFNLWVQIFCFGVVSSFVYGLTRLLSVVNAVPEGLLNGMVICSCLPMSINMVTVLTKICNGDEAAAVFNAAGGNLLGVFLSPVLILLYLGVSGNNNLLEVFWKLSIRVVLPVIVGQILRYFIRSVREFADNHKYANKAMQQYSLVFIVYTVFCKTFKKGPSTSIGEVFLMSE
jgi:solute carrier family 10 (sodium/bile acid cotransporter), member 7